MMRTRKLTQTKDALIKVGNHLFSLLNQVDIQCLEEFRPGIQDGCKNIPEPLNIEKLQKSSWKILNQQDKELNL